MNDYMRRGGYLRETKESNFFFRRPLSDLEFIVVPFFYFIFNSITFFSFVSFCLSCLVLKLILMTNFPIFFRLISSENTPFTIFSFSFGQKKNCFGYFSTYVSFLYIRWYISQNCSIFQFENEHPKKEKLQMK